MVKTNIVAENRQLKRNLKRVVKENRKFMIMYNTMKSKLLDKNNENSCLRDANSKLTKDNFKLRQDMDNLLDDRKRLVETKKELTTMNGA